MGNEPQKETTEQIWRELSDRQRRFVKSRIKPDADGDDILQTVFLRIHSGINDLREVDRLESWVFQIARNAVTDHFRKKRDTQSDIESLIDDSDDARIRERNDGTRTLSGLVDRPTSRRPKTSAVDVRVRRSLTERHCSSGVNLVVRSEIPYPARPSISGSHAEIVLRIPTRPPWQRRRLRNCQRRLLRQWLRLEPPRVITES